MPKKQIAAKQRNTKKIGESTAFKMKQKLGQFKAKKGQDEEINSVDSADEQNKDKGEDPFLVGMNNDEAEGETAEEKRLRLTKKIISEYAAEEKNDFFTSLVAKSTAEQDVMAADDNQLTKRMKF